MVRPFLLYLCEHDIQYFLLYLCENSSWQVVPDLWRGAGYQNMKISILSCVDS